MSTPTNKINLQIITPEKVAFQGEADGVSIPTKSGEITVLANHIRLISIMEHGELIIRNGKEEIFMAVCKGFVEVKNNCVIIMTDIAERIAEIDEAKAREAKEKAKKLLSEKDRLSDVSFADTTAILEKSLARIKVARRKRK